MNVEQLNVPYCDTVDLNYVCERMNLVAFDLDGTLARSKKPMHEDMAYVLSRLTALIPVAIVSGGTMALVRSQVTDILTDDAHRETMHIMPTSGTRYYRWQDNQWTAVYEHDLAIEDRKRAIESLEYHAKKLGIWPKEPYGPVIEDRGSQITYSALGQLAPVEEKEQFDPTNEKKNALANAVQKDLPNLEVRSGGSTSVDIYARGIDKAFAVRELAQYLHIPVSTIAFIGDRMDPDGNDYPAALAGTMAIRVRGPEDTITVCTQMIDWLTAHQTKQA